MEEDATDIKKRFAPKGFQKMLERNIIYRFIDWSGVA